MNCPRGADLPSERSHGDSSDSEMKNRISRMFGITSLLAAGIALSSCSAPVSTDTSRLIGGGIGAVGGGLIGNRIGERSGNRTAGTLFGAAAGAAIGSNVGQQVGAGDGTIKSTSQGTPNSYEQ